MKIFWETHLNEHWVSFQELLIVLINGFTIKLYNAKHFESEVTLYERAAFTLCYHKCKAILPALSRYEHFKSLYDRLSSNKPSTKWK